MPGEWQDFASLKWPPLLRNLNQMVLADAHLDDRSNFLQADSIAHGSVPGVRSNGIALNKTIASVLSLRGVETAIEETTQLARSIFRCDDLASQERTIVTSSCSPMPWLLRHTGGLGGSDQARRHALPSAAVLGNSQSVAVRFAFTTFAASSKISSALCLVLVFAAPTRAVARPCGHNVA
eukprot:SAG31_NODE_326_length_17664_cov_10.038543_18_plen_180_part_00